MPKQKTSGDKKKKMPVPKTPEKTRLDKSDGDDSGTPTTPKSKKKPAPVRTVQECRADKWVADLDSAISYRQRMNISIHNLPEGCNHADHTDYVRQLLRQGNVVNIKSLDEWIKDLQGLTSTHHVGLRTALSEWKNKQMGNSGVMAQYVVKAFLEPGTQ